MQRIDLWIRQRKKKWKRKALGETQVSAAAIAKTSQSRYAKVEHADSSVSLELMIKMFFALGASKKELLKTLSA